MANNERKLAKPSLIPLEIDPTSILSLSKGVIFDTIVHNIEYTLNNRRTDPLPWKLTGMSLICDPSRNKKYMQKLQKMQCVRSVICTQIYHSKLVKTEAGQLTTPGRKIILPTVPCKRLTGIFVCRSIDELLYMESSGAENIHFIQYKLLSYERIATRELVNGPKLSSVDGKIIKTVFDFELSQQFDFPRQLLPVAIISFSRQEGCDLCSSIRHFLQLDDHKTFDKSYLVTSINVEIDRLREEDERRQDTEAEKAIIWEKIHRRPPLADLSKKTTDSGNTRSVPSPLRLPPLKVKLPRPEKPTVPNLSIDSNYKCWLKLDRIDLSSFDISNLTDMQSYEPTHTKSKSLTINKPHDSQKQLKRLSSNESKQPSKTNQNTETTSEQQSTGTLKITISMNNRQQRSTSSSSSMSPTYRPKPIFETQSSDKTTTTKKKKVKRPVLPSEYHCSLNLSRINLSQYDLDLPPPPPPPHYIKETSSSETLSSCDQEVEPSKPLENLQQRTESILPMKRKLSDAETKVPKRLLNIVEGFSTPDLNEMESTNNEDIIISLNEDSHLSSSTTTTDDSLPTLTNEIVTQAVDSIITVKPDLHISNPISSEINNQSPEDCIIIVPCSDDDLDDDDDDDFFIRSIQTNLDSIESDMKSNTHPPPPPLPLPPSLSNQTTTTSPLRNHPSLTRILTNADRFESTRLSTSSRSSTCSSLSTTIMHPHSPQTPLSLISVLIPDKILHKKQTRSPSSSVVFTRFDTLIPILAQESQVDPRLIYRLKAITTDLHWSIPCSQCLLSPYTVSKTFEPSTRTILFERKSSTDFVDPRRDSLKNAILSHIYHRLKILLPNILLTTNLNQCQQLLFEQTNFQTNCSLHLEYLLHQLKQLDDTNFLQMIKTNEEFQLSTDILQLISS